MFHPHVFICPKLFILFAFVAAVGWYIWRAKQTFCWGNAGKKSFASNIKFNCTWPREKGFVVFFFVCFSEVLFCFVN